jgi:hypothetical protein
MIRLWVFGMLLHESIFVLITQQIRKIKIKIIVLSQTTGISHNGFICIMAIQEI